MRAWLTRRSGGVPRWVWLLSVPVLLVALVAAGAAFARTAPPAASPSATASSSPTSTPVPSAPSATASPSPSASATSGATSGTPSASVPPSSAPSRSASAGPSASPRAGARFTVPAEPRLLVFGDSYTEGYAASPETDGFAYRLGPQLGWASDVQGKGGTGYTYGGSEGSAADYVGRIRTYIKDSRFDPDVIVLEGSQNDYRAVGSITGAVLEAVRLLQGAYPDARIVLFGPAAPQPLQSQLGPIDSAVAAAAARARLPYISPYREQWFTAANTGRYGWSDGSHLNTAGHAYLAQRFLEDFRPLFGLSAR